MLRYPLKTTLHPLVLRNWMGNIKVIHYMSKRVSGEWNTPALQHQAACSLPCRCSPSTYPSSLTLYPHSLPLPYCTVIIYVPFTFPISLSTIKPTSSQPCHHALLLSHAPSLCHISPEVFSGNIYGGGYYQMWVIAQFNFALKHNALRRGKSPQAYFKAYF